MTEEPTPEQIEREFTMWRNSEVDRTGTLPTGYEMFRAAYELAASAVNGRHDHIEDGSSYLDCIACVAATSRSRPTRMADAVIVDMLTAFYGAERDGWSTKKVARMRAALVAAAGAAPQEPMPAPSKYINPSLPGMIRNLWKSDPSEASVRVALGLAGDLIQELIDLRAVPVEPVRIPDRLEVDESDEFSFDEIESAAWAVGFLMSKHAYDAITSRDGARVALKDLYEKLAREAARLRGGGR